MADSFLSFGLRGRCSHGNKAPTNSGKGADTTTVSFDGKASPVFDGIFTPEELNAALADPDDIDFTAKP